MESRSLSTSAPKFIVVSDYSIGEKPNIAFSFSIIPLAKINEISKYITNNVPCDLKHTNYTDPMIKVLTSSDVMNFCVISTEKTFIKNIFNRKNVLKSFEIQEGELKTIEGKDFFDLDGVIKRNSEVILKLNQKSANISLIKNIILTASFAAYFSSKFSSLSKVSEILWLSDRDNMTTYASGIIFDLYRINCYTMPYRNLNTSFKFIKEENYSQFDKLLRIADFTAGAFADYNFNENIFSLPKHEQIVRALIESDNSYIFKVDHSDGTLSVGKVSYINS